MSASTARQGLLTHITCAGPHAEIISESTVKLWETYQKASQVLDEDFQKLGFLDLAVFGAQSTGKSTLLSALCGLQLPTGGEIMTKCPIRIMVDQHNNAATVEIPGRGDVPLPEGIFTKELYTDALKVSHLHSCGRIAIFCGLLCF